MTLLLQDSTTRQCRCFRQCLARLGCFRAPTRPQDIPIAIHDIFVPPFVSAKASRRAQGTARRWPKANSKRQSSKVLQRVQNNGRHVFYGDLMLVYRDLPETGSREAQSDIVVVRNWLGLSWLDIYLPLLLHSKSTAGKGEAIDKQKKLSQLQHKPNMKFFEIGVLVSAAAASSTTTTGVAFHIAPSHALRPVYSSSSCATSDSSSSPALFSYVIPRGAKNSNRVGHQNCHALGSSLLQSGSTPDGSCSSTSTSLQKEQETSRPFSPNGEVQALY